MAAGEFASICKRTYVQIAAKEQRRKLGRVNQSRIAIVTGLTRAEVKKLLGGYPSNSMQREWHTHRAARVLTGWHTDPRFLDSKGRPAILRISGRATSFKALVRKYAGDVPARSLLDELLDSASVIRASTHSVKVRSRSIVSNQLAPAEMRELAARASGYMRTLVSNGIAHGVPLFEARVRTTRIASNELPLLLRSIASRSGSFVASIQDELRLAQRSRGAVARTKTSEITLTLFLEKGDD